MESGNIFYFKKINRIGGTEQFLYEIAKKYHKYDITIFYDEADPFQLKRLRKFVRVQKRKKGEKITCKKAFFNYNIDMIDDVEAEEYIFISHAIYQEMGFTPPKHEKITKVIGVSKYSTEKIGELLGESQVCYNPLTIEPAKKVIRLISATRLNDNTKGGNRTVKLIQALDKYCLDHNRNYLWLIFTNEFNKKVDSPNICIMKGRTDIRPYIADSDYLVQLSNDMETYCYSVNEALSYGVPVVTTPLSVLKEFNLTDEMRIECDWDMDNADEVAKQIFERKRRKFTYEAPKDDWESLLDHSPSAYDPNAEIKVKATGEWLKRNIFDKERGNIPQENETWVIDGARWDELESFRERTGISLVERI